MILIWRPYWYELDQSIVVGDIDYFYITKDKLQFANGTVSDNDYEIKVEIQSIKHNALGEVKGIITIGLDYTIYLHDGEKIQVNAEESPGKLYGCELKIDDWNFGVSVKVIEETGVSSKYRLNTMSCREIKTINQKRLENYKRLLNDEIL
ncbi:hypothetical protein [Ruminiclostridium cellobioparum]|uniref:Uncharacterized protein n=1 Tax=Ruminiclostridium cellobioparum subsp. termitidis CT1112 TaxID=1195236 RepID=S0FKU5_RUMCE|nr:hypothetical protein [Ruminiclostridium cellobioparum]EMS69143.1 hypothetical protein CTER_5240 [Ruminiclostridium cellobioparum subsp. termitidis CT1112]